MVSDNPFALSEGKHQGRAISDNPLTLLKNKGQGRARNFFMINLLVCSVILIDEEEGTSDMVLKNIRCHTRSINI